MLTLGPLIATLIATAVIGSTSSRSPTDELIRKGWKEFNDGHRRTAVKLFKDGLRDHPTEVLLHYAYQTAMNDIGRYRESQAEYEKRLSENAKDPLSYGLLELVSDNYPEMKRLVKEGLRQAPNDQWLQSLDVCIQASDLIRSGHEAQAVALLRSLEPRSSKIPFYWNQLAYAYMAGGDFTNAEKAATRAVELYPNVIDNRLILASIFIETFELTKALDTLNVALKIHDSTSIHVYKGVIFHLMGRNKEMISEEEKALSLPKDNSSWESFMAQAYGSKKDFKNMGRYAEKAIELDPKDTGSTALMVSKLIHDGRLDEATATAQAAVDGNPNDASALYALSAVYESSGNHKEASKVYGKILERHPNAVDAMAAKGTCDYFSGDPKEGRAVLDKALKLAPNCSNVLDAEGWAKLMEGDYLSSYHAFENSLAIDPTDSSTKMGLAWVEWSGGMYEKAKVMIERILAEEKEDHPVQALLKTSLEELEKQLQGTVPYPKEDPPTRLVYYRMAPKPHLAFQIAYEKGGQLWIGEPWSDDARAIYRSTTSSLGGVAWAPDLNAIYFSETQWRSEPNASIRIVKADSRSGKILWASALPPRRANKSHFLINAFRGLKALFYKPARKADSFASQMRVGRLQATKDGGRILFTTELGGSNSLDEFLERISADGMKGPEILYRSEEASDTLEFNARSETFLVFKSTGEVFRLSPNFTKEELLAKDSRIGGVTLSPDGKSLLLSLSCFCSFGEFELLNLEDGTKRFLGIRGSRPSMSPDGKRLAYLWEDQVRIFDFNAQSVEMIRADQVDISSGGLNAGGFFETPEWSSDSRYFSTGMYRHPEGKPNDWRFMGTAILDTQLKELWISPNIMKVIWPPEFQ